MAKKKTTTKSKEESKPKKEKIKKLEKEEQGDIDNSSIHFPEVDHLKVVEILDDGRETEEFYHCKMSDGTTRHVEKRLFQ